MNSFFLAFSFCCLAVCGNNHHHHKLYSNLYEWFVWFFFFLAVNIVHMYSRRCFFYERQIKMAYQPGIPFWLCSSIRSEIKKKKLVWRSGSFVFFLLLQNDHHSEFFLMITITNMMMMMMNKHR